MFQEDPQMGSPSAIIRIDLSELGMEAQSILKSIRTEHGKLAQSQNLALSDLHYFRARYKYYRLSLMRLLPNERKSLEPVLDKFREAIYEVERSFEDSGSFEPKQSVTPFIVPVEEVVESSSTSAFVSRPAPETKNLTASPAKSDSNVGSQIGSSTSASALIAELRSELELIDMALEAPISEQRKQTIQKNIKRIIRQLEKPE